MTPKTGSFALYLGSRDPERQDDPLVEVTTQAGLTVQSNLLMWSPQLRDHLPEAATFSMSLDPKYSANEPVLRGHLS